MIGQVFTTEGDTHVANDSGLRRQHQLHSGVAGDVGETEKCLLRAEIVRTYYRNLGEKQLRQYEFENLAYCYAAYRQLGGNSFVEHIYIEMQDWDVTR